jgi:hypothetical protein
MGISALVGGSTREIDTVSKEEAFCRNRPKAATAAAQAKTGKVYPERAREFVILDNR